MIAFNKGLWLLFSQITISRSMNNRCVRCGSDDFEMIKLISDPPELARMFCNNCSFYEKINTLEPTSFIWPSDANAGDDWLLYLKFTDEVGNWKQKITITE